ncbi:MAG TPA: cytochrome c oxidase subunit II [Xanthobacteraceae bacterium]
MARPRGLIAGLAAGLFTPALANAQEFSHGLSYMTAFGPKNYSVVTLLYAVIIISLAVVAIIGGLVLVGALMKRERPPDDRLAEVPLHRSASGMPFIYIGLIPSFLILLGTLIWNYVVLADVAQPHAKPAATVSVVGHQWWWEVRYQNDDPSRAFTTANEIHVPVGQPVRVELGTDDVIHSFWVPALTGKMDTIPGQNNVTWMQADRPGIYRGQCTEYCGQQHAHMGLFVVADLADDFKSWWNHQLEGPAVLNSEAEIAEAAAGQTVFMRRCAVCHTVLGTRAGGRVGPNLSHLMERRSIAAATLPNGIGYLSGWISDPQHIKPGNLMPNIPISPMELTQLRAFLQTLR